MGNRLKRPYLIEYMNNDGHDIVKEAVIKIIPKRKKCKKAKWFSEETLQIAEKRREAKGKEEGKIYPSECRVPKDSKRDKKAFLSEQCKEIEENNRIGKTSDLFNKIRGFWFKIVE